MSELSEATDLPTELRKIEHVEAICTHYGMVRVDGHPYAWVSVEKKIGVGIAAVGPTMTNVTVQNVAISNNHKTLGAGVLAVIEPYTSSSAKLLSVVLDALING